MKWTRTLLKRAESERTRLNRRLAVSEFTLFLKYHGKGATVKTARAHHVAAFVATVQKTANVAPATAMRRVSDLSTYYQLRGWANPCLNADGSRPLVLQKVGRGMAITMTQKYKRLTKEPVRLHHVRQILGATKRVALNEAFIVALLVMYVNARRPQALLGLRTTDVVEVKPGKVVYQQFTKTAKVKQERFIVTDPPKDGKGTFKPATWFARLIRRVEAEGETEVFCGLTYKGFAEHLSNAVVKYCPDLDHKRVKPGSIRHGAATDMRAAGRSIAELKQLGRWTTESTPRHYAQQSQEAASAALEACMSVGLGSSSEEHGR